jgi:uncharacterized damage-inducible protein DinB
MSDANPINALLSRCAAIPGRIAQAVKGRNEEELRTRPLPDNWSIVEIFAHMRAVDDIFTPRIYAILVRDAVALVAYDERRWAEIAHYEQLELHTSLHLFTLRRAELVNTLRSLVLEDWQRIGIHEEWGPITLLAVLTFFIEHEEEHCAQIVAINNARS